MVIFKCGRANHCICNENIQADFNWTISGFVNSTTIFDWNWSGVFASFSCIGQLYHLY